MSLPSEKERKDREREFVDQSHIAGDSGWELNISVFLTLFQF